MKKVILAMLAGLAIAVYFTDIQKSNAEAYTEVIEVVGGVDYSTAGVYGVSCTTYSATSLVASFPSGYNMKGIRVQNQDSSKNVYIGYNLNVSTFGSVAMGEKVSAGGNATYDIGKPLTPYCKSDGATATWVSVFFLGYK